MTYCIYNFTIAEYSPVITWALLQFDEKKPTLGRFSVVNSCLWLRKIQMPKSQTTDDRWPVGENSVRTADCRLINPLSA